MARKPTAADRARSAYRRRRWLIEQMGAICALCDRTEEELGEALEFDHPHGRDWTPRKTSRWQRMVLYIRDWKAGNLRLACRSCNARTSGRFRGKHRTPE